MPVSVTMPRLGESVTEGTVTRWLKREGDRVEADEPLLEVSTDKVDTEIPAPASGVLTRIVVQEDQTAEVGSELAVIAGDGESTGDAPAPAEQSAPAVPAAPVPSPAPAPAPAPAPVSPPAPIAAVPPAPAPAAAASQPPPAGATSVTMPALGESVTEGTVTRWLKRVGETVEADEPLLEVSTDKVDTEIPAPAGGVLLAIMVAEDGIAAVGAELAVIGAAGAAPAGPAAPAPIAQPAAPTPAAVAAVKSVTPASVPAAAPAAVRQPAPATATLPAPGVILAATATATPPAAGPARPTDGEDGGGYVTPLVRRLAAEQGVDLSSIPGTGVGGRIRKQDVLDAAEQARAEAARAEAARAGASTAGASTAGAASVAAKPATAAAAPSSPLRGRTEKMSRLRSIIAKRMVESLQTSAQLTTVVEVDVTKIARLRDQAKSDFAELHGVKLSFLPFFALATVEALRMHPSVNASIDMEAGTVTYHDAEHLAVAVDTDRGLLVPVIRNAGDLNLVGLAKRITDLAERTRTMKIDPDELSGGTFTLTNTGSRGALFDTPIINQPQVGILGTGSVVKRAIVVDDPDLGELVVPRSMVYLALSYDHRLVDGADGARFLTTVKERLEAGAFEAELGLS